MHRSPGGLLCPGQPPPTVPPQSPPSTPWSPWPTHRQHWGGGLSGLMPPTPPLPGGRLTSAPGMKGPLWQLLVPQGPCRAPAPQRAAACVTRGKRTVAGEWPEPGTETRGRRPVRIWTDLHPLAHPAGRGLRPGSPREAVQSLWGGAAPPAGRADLKPSCCRLRQRDGAAPLSPSPRHSLPVAPAAQRARPLPALRRGPARATAESSWPHAASRTVLHQRCPVPSGPGTSV